MKKILTKNSPAAYSDIIPIIDLALEKPGLRVEFDTVGKAINFRQRCYRYINLLRNLEYERLGEIPGMPIETSYDVLTIRFAERQINEETGKLRATSSVLQFDHKTTDDFQTGKVKVIDPETGRPIKIEKPKLSLFDEEDQS